MYVYALCIIRTRVFNKIAVYPRNQLLFGGARIYKMGIIQRITGLSITKE